MDGLRRSEHASEEYRAGEFGTAAAAFRAHGRMQQHACYVLEEFCEQLDTEELRPYMRPVVAKMLGFLRDDAVPRPGPKLQEMALSVVRRGAAAAPTGG